MSGEAVGFPAALGVAAAGGAVLAVGAFVVPGTLAAMAIKALVDARVNAVVASAEGEDAESRAWRAACEASARANGARQAEFARFQAQCEGLRSVQMQAVAGERYAAGKSTAEAFRIGTEESGKERQARSMAEALAGLLREIPEFISAAPRSPVEQLRARVAKLQAAGAGVTLDEAESLRAVISETLSAFEARLQKVLAHDEDARTKALAVAEEIRALGRLAVRDGDRARAGTLAQEIAAMEAGGTAAVVSRLPAIRERMAGLRKEIEQAVEFQAFRTSLARRTIEHLEEMGYVLLESIPEELGEGAIAWRMSVPYGEQIQVQLENDGQIGFRLLHEARGLARAATEGMEFYRQQERHWCQDLRRLFGRLVADGYDYRLQDWETPEANLGLVTVEAADEIVQGSARRRLGKAKTQRREQSS